MRNLFLLNIALALLYSIIGYSKTSSIRCQEETEVYKQNEHIIDSLVNIRTIESILKINNMYRIPAEGRKTLGRYVYNREFRLVHQDFLHRDSLYKRIENKMRIESIYDDSINMVLIPAYDNHITGENVSFALYCSKQLGLDSVQYNYIMSKALDMARRIKKDYRVNVWNEEMDVLKNTLDKRQLYSFFKIKNSIKITDEFRKAWKRLNDAGLTEQLDSAKDANDAINYMFNKQMIKDLYRSYGTPQKKYLSELDKNMPKMIKMLNGLDKKIRIEENEKNRTVGKEFIW